MSFSNVGLVWSPLTFAEYLRGKKPPLWATSVTIHHTAAPSLAQRPDGFTAQHIRNIQSYYQQKLGWTKGPHFFTDEDQIWGMTPPTTQGIHAKSFNSASIGIEVLGNFDVEDPSTGRGKLCWETTAIATKILLDWLGVSANSRTVLFHRDDPKTTKTCPGTKVTKEAFIALVNGSHIDPEVLSVGPIETGVAPTEMVELVPYLATRLSKTYSQISSSITKEGKQFVALGKWIEGAYYDKVKKATMAPKSELDEVFPIFLPY